MARPVLIDLLCEDRGHEQFLAPLVRRIVLELDRSPDVRVVSARGGAPQLHNEVGLLIRALDAGRSHPDVLIVGQDGNCNGWQQTASRIRDRVGSKWEHTLVTACPDPHIEKWYLADQTAFTRVVGGKRQSIPARKCEKGFYKGLLTGAIDQAGAFDASGGLDFGPDLALKMDLHATCRDNPDLADFVDCLRARIKAAAVL